MKTPAIGIILLFCYWHAPAQTVTSSVVNSSGQSFVKDQISLEWSIGESFITTLHAGDESSRITQGFLQPLTPKGISTPIFSPGEVIIVPNPTPDFSELNILSAQQGQLQLQLSDAQGKIIWKEECKYLGNGQVKKLDLRNYAAGVYFLSLSLQPLPGSVGKKGVYKLVRL